KQKVTIVTGCSSGIGHEISLILARNGFTTYATMRNLQKGSDLKSIAEDEKLPLHFAQLDVTDENSVKKAIKTQYETNVFGLIRTTQSVLPIMRKQRSGLIVNISSGAGRFGFPTGSAYV